MSKFFRISRVERYIGNERTISLNESFNLGASIRGVKTSSKIIKVHIEPLEINGILTESLKHELAGVLNVNEAKKMVFSDEPDKYYLGLAQGEISTEKVARWYQRAVITFLIPDGVAHSTTYKKFLDYTKDGNKLIFKLQNEGNTNALPIIKIKHNSENGYIGIANETGAFALGSVEEEDGTIVHRNEVLFDYSKAIAKALDGAPNVAKLNHMPPTYDTELKRMRIDNILGSGKGGEYVVIGNRGTTPGYTEHVGTRTFIINPDSNGEYTLNEHLWWQQIFIATAQDQKGFLKLCVTGIDDEGNDEFLYGIETYKRKNGFETEYNFFALDDDGVGWRFYKQFKFQADRNYHNPFSMNRSRAV